MRMVFTRARSKRQPARDSAYEPGRRRVRVFAAGIAVLFLGVAAASWWYGRDDLRAGSKVLSEGGAPLAIGTIPKTYRAVYRVDNMAGKDVRTFTERYWVRRPFDSRIETWTGPPPGRTLRSVRQSELGLLSQRSVGTPAPLNVAAPPSLASGDLRVDAVLAEAVRTKVVDRRELREVYGRRCQVYRFGGPVFAGDVTPYEPGRGEYADVCIDARGIVLEETWISRGRMINRRVAVDVDVDVAIADALLRSDVPSTPSPDRGSVDRIPPEQAARLKLWAFPEDPEGFEPLGRYNVIFPMSAIPQSPGGGPPGPPPVSTADVYVRGPDLIVIDQDPSLEPLVRRDQRASRPLELPEFESADLIVDARSSEIRARDDEDSVVRIFGTVTPAELARLARSLVRTSD